MNTRGYRGKRAIRWPRRIDLASILAVRPIVAHLWADCLPDGARADPRVARSIPSVLIDRFGFALLCGSSQEESTVPGFDILDFVSRRAELLTASIKPTRSLDNWTTPLNGVVDVGALYFDLRARWKQFAKRVGLPSELALLANPIGIPWRDYFDQDTFYPRPPVISGPNFFDQLTKNDRLEILERLGRTAPIDFFCFMHQVHEELHRHQSGEPLMNEIVVAAIWTEFLDSEQLWSFQRNSATGVALVQELRVARAIPDLAPRAIEAGLDTAKYFVRSGQPAAYVLACRWATVFDERRTTYGRYLDGMEWLLQNGIDEEWVASADRRLCKDLRSKKRLIALWVE